VTIHHRFSVEHYHRMIEAGILDEDDKVELLEGYLVLRPYQTPRHNTVIRVVHKALADMLPAGWDIRILSAVTLPDSEPEPDLAVVRGDERSYFRHHPGPSEIGLLVEVADYPLARDREDKARIYARAGIAIYWIDNLVDRQVEVMTVPSGPSAAPAYGQRQVHTPGADVPVILDGKALGSVLVRDLLP
jgi:Uma2 family endonuclease